MPQDADLLQARADAYRLASTFMSLPTPELAQAVADGSVAASIQEIMGILGIDETRTEEIVRGFAVPAEQDPSELHRDMRRDYTRLFTNPEHPLVRIYESVFRDAGNSDTSNLVFISPTALDAERCYRENGLRMDPARSDSADHMGAELDFVGHLYDLLANEADDGSTSAALDEFMRKHLLAWGISFFEQVERLALTGVYRSIGAFGATLLRA